jgi:uncharacterized protein
MEITNEFELEKSILRDSKTVAIVGVSDKPDRPSNGVAEWLLANSHYDLYFVNPAITELFGRPVYKSLEEVPVKIDLVDVFRKTSDLPPIFESALALKVPAIWLQLGIMDEALATHAREQGVKVIMNKCLKVEYDLYR